MINKVDFFVMPKKEYLNNKHIVILKSNLTDAEKNITLENLYKNIENIKTIYISKDFNDIDYELLNKYQYLNLYFEHDINQINYAFNHTIKHYYNTNLHVEKEVIYALLDNNTAHVIDYDIYNLDELKLVTGRNFNMPSIILDQYIVTELQDYCFYGLERINKITLPLNLKRIGKAAFSRNTRLTAITLNEGLIEIDENAFERCNKLKDIIIPESVIKIGSNAFEGVFLGTLYFYNDQFKYEVSVFNPDKITVKYDFKDLIMLNGIKYALFKDDTASVLGYEKLYYKKDKVIIPMYVGEKYLVDTIANAAFDSDPIFDIELPDSIKTIGFRAFSFSELKKIKLSKNITYIDEAAFEGCINLEKITLPSKLTKITKALFANCVRLKEVKLGSKITMIDECTFQNCRSLKTINFPKNLEVINELAFQNCNKLIYLEIPKKVNYIAADAFSDLHELGVVVILSESIKLGSNSIKGGADTRIYIQESHDNLTNMLEISKKIKHRTTIAKLIVKEFNGIKYLCIEDEFKTASLISYNPKKIKRSISILEEIEGYEVVNINNGAFKKE